MADQVVCKACGFHGEPGTVTKGSFAVEVILWLCFLIPGLIYSFWRLSSRHENCPKCGSSEIIPIDSPIGQKLMAEIAPQTLATLPERYRPTTGKRGGLAWKLGKMFSGGPGRK
jgi:hypothetical protein